jgi:hypothetical protein
VIEIIALSAIGGIMNYPFGVRQSIFSIIAFGYLIQIALFIISGRTKSAAIAKTKFAPGSSSLSFYPIYSTTEKRHLCENLLI